MGREVTATITGGWTVIANNGKEMTMWVILEKYDQQFIFLSEAKEASEAHLKLTPVNHSETHLLICNVLNAYFLVNKWPTLPAPEWSASNRTDKDLKWSATTENGRGPQKIKQMTGKTYDVWRKVREISERGAPFKNLQFLSFLSLLHCYAQQNFYKK